MTAVSSISGVVLAKIESTFGVDSSPVAGTDAILVGSPTVDPTVTFVERNNARATQGRQAAVAGRTLATASFTWELRGSGTAGTPPAISDVLRACGMQETIVASTSVAYAPRSDGFESCTLYVYLEGTLFKLVGCRGSMSVDMPAGNNALCTFNLTGRLVEDPSDASLPAPTHDTVQPPIVESINFTIDGDALDAASVSFDQQNEVSPRESVNSPDGYIGGAITARAPSMSADPEYVAEATHAFWGKFMAGTPSAVALTVGTVAGNIASLNAPVAQYSAIANANRNNLRTYDISMRLYESGTNDEFSLTFT